MPGAHLKPMSRTAENSLLGILLVMVLGLLPIYIFPSGGFQVVDVLILAVSFITLFKICYDFRFFYNEIFFLVPFIIWACLIEMLYYVSSPEDLSYIKTAIQIIYVIVILFIFMVIFANTLIENQYRYLYVGLLISSLIPFIVTGYKSHEWALRTTLSFNDPNQLGYFAIILVSFLILIINNTNATKGKFFTLISLIIFIIANGFVFLSLSRSAGAAMILLDVYFVYTLIKRRMYFWIIGLLLALLVILGIKYHVVMQVLNNPEVLKRLSLETILDNLKVRTFDKLTYFTDYQFLIGCAQGGKSRFWDNLEIHNIFLMILRSYGVIGLMLFSAWFVRLVWITSNRLQGALWVWTALLFYNSFVIGTRFRPFWVLIALMIVMAKLLELRPRYRTALGQQGEAAWPR